MHTCISIYIYYTNKHTVLICAVLRYCTFRMAFQMAFRKAFRMSFRKAFRMSLLAESKQRYAAGAASAEGFAEGHPKGLAKGTVPQCSTVCLL